VRIPDEDGQEEFTLNLTPMIDVVFLLLIFFMVATTFLDPEREIGIDLPEAESGVASEVDDDEVIVNIMADGSLFLSGEPIDDAGLTAALDRAARNNPETPVTIRGDANASHKHIVRVMDACGQARLTNLSVGTLENRGQ